MRRFGGASSVRRSSGALFRVSAEERILASRAGSQAGRSPGTVPQKNGDRRGAKHGHDDVGGTKAERGCGVALPDSGLKTEQPGGVHEKGQPHALPGAEVIFAGERDEVGELNVFRRQKPEEHSEVFKNRVCSGAGAHGDAQNELVRGQGEPVRDAPVEKPGGVEEVIALGLNQRAGPQHDEENGENKNRQVTAREILGRFEPAGAGKPDGGEAEKQQRKGKIPGLPPLSGEPRKEVGPLPQNQNIRGKERHAQKLRAKRLAHIGDAGVVHCFRARNRVVRFSVIAMTVARSPGACACVQLWWGKGDKSKARAALRTRETQVPPCGGILRG